MSCRTGRSSLCTMTPPALRYDRPLMPDQSRPSATSLTVKSNSLRATKSTAGASRQAGVGLDGDLGADQADLEAGIGGLEAPRSPARRTRTRASRCAARRGRSRAPRRTTASRPMRCGGASISFEPSTRAAGCASQVGYQNELDLAPRLVARAGAAVEAVEGRRLQKKGPHHERGRLRSGMRLPSGVTR